MVVKALAIQASQASIARVTCQSPVVGYVAVMATVMDEGGQVLLNAPMYVSLIRYMECYAGLHDLRAYRGMSRH